jgi:5,10-methylenetetrahydromethanopterin reductase
MWVPETWGRDSISQIACSLGATSKLRVGTGIIPVYSRTPTLIAQTAATLDEISGGRFLLGLGVSASPVIENWHGIPFASPLKRIREYVEIIRLTLSGERVNFDGTYFHLHSFRLPFKPVRRDVPIYVAALGPHMVQLAGEIADGLLLYFNPFEEIRKSVKTFRKGATAAGRDSTKLDVAAYVTASVSEDSREAKKVAKYVIAHYLGWPAPYHSKLLKSYGYGREVSLIKAAWERGKREDAVNHVSDAMVQSLAIAGTPGECRRKVEEYRTAGIKLPILYFYWSPGSSMKNAVGQIAKVLA